MSLIRKKLLRRAKRQPVSAKAVVLADDKVLLLRQPDGRWDLPGGKVDPGELVTEGLAREVHEETGLTVGPLKMLATGTRARESRDDLFVFFFLCTLKAKYRAKQVRLSAEHQEFKLVDFRKARRMNLPKPDRLAIAAAEKHLKKTAVKAG